ncbi:MAG: alpha/beta hydrolase [Alphaproteobacteria bacterium]|nr:alpha/beta hydrolase [Alphaproteobacteria bacterium]
MNFTDKHIVSSSSSGQHKVAYLDWGNPKDKPIICVHGLTGNARDFDYLAHDLVTRGYRVISITLPGRGASDFLSNPLDYNYSQYITDIFEVLKVEGFDKPACVDWIGISLGGLLGIQIAGMDDTPIKRLIINDVGPVVPKAALEFIHKVIKEPYYFDSVGALEQRMRATRGLTWGPVTDGQWRHMAVHNHRVLSDGRVTYAYDPKIAVVFEDAPIGDVDLWQMWENISCPVLLIHGKKSMLLTKKIIKMMRKTGVEFDLVTLKKCGHAPSLMAPSQIEMIEEWLEEA